jgi:hypothetical protein
MTVLLSYPPQSGVNCTPAVFISGNGFAVLKRTVSVSARNRRIIYSVKHINSYILKKDSAAKHV